MSPENENLTSKEVVNRLLEEPIWDELRTALNEQDEAKVKELVGRLVHAMENDHGIYDKRTFEIRKSLHKEMKQYCIEHGYTQKTFINVAIQTLLHVGP